MHRPLGGILPLSLRRQLASGRGPGAELCRLLPGQTVLRVVRAAICGSVDVPGAVGHRPRTSWPARACFDTCLVVLDHDFVLADEEALFEGDWVQLVFSRAVLFVGLSPDLILRAAHLHRPRRQPDPDIPVPPAGVVQVLVLAVSPRVAVDTIACERRAAFSPTTSNPGGARWREVGCLQLASTSIRLRCTLGR